MNELEKLRREITTLEREKADIVESRALREKKAKLQQDLERERKQPGKVLKAAGVIGSDLKKVGGFLGGMLKAAAPSYNASRAAWLKDENARRKARGLPELR